MSKKNLAQRTKRWLLRALALLLLANVLFFALRANLGPVDSWLKRTAPDNRSLQKVAAGTATLELLEPVSPGAANAGESAPIDYPAGARCTFLSVEASPQAPLADSDTDFSAAATASSRDVGIEVGAQSEHAAAAQAQMQSLEQRLAAVGLAAHMVKVNTETLQRHVVYIEGVAERDLHSRLRRAHASHHNAFIVSLQGGGRVVALGFYNSESEAMAAKKTIAEQAEALAVGVYSETEQRLFLLLSPSASKNLSARLWAELREDFPELQRAEKYCDSVAPAAQTD